MFLNNYHTPQYKYNTMYSIIPVHIHFHFISFAVFHLAIGTTSGISIIVHVQNTFSFRGEASGNGIAEF